MPVPKGSLMTSLGRVGLSLIVASLLPVAARSQAPDVVREPASDVAFPVRLSPPGSTGEHVLAGTAIRTKTIFRIKVYAFGLYVDADAARVVLAQWAGMEPKALEKNEAMFSRMLDMDFGMTLRLVMTRDVDGDTMAEAFEKSLAPRVETAASEMNMPGGTEALAQFRGYFGLDKVTDDSELIFSCVDGMLFSTIKGEAAEPIASPALCWALFDIYLGDKPISSGAKKNFGKGMAGVLATGDGM